MVRLVRLVKPILVSIILVGIILPIIILNLKIGNASKILTLPCFSVRGSDW